MEIVALNSIIVVFPYIVVFGGVVFIESFYFAAEIFSSSLSGCLSFKKFTSLCLL